MDQGGWDTADGPVIVGKYHVLQRIAVGGMAQVYLAKAVGPHGFQKVVALKKIHAHYATDPEFVEMFLAEARLAATLQHPNVATVYEIGGEAGSYFFAMEYIHGRDVSRVRLASKGGVWPLPLAEILYIVCSAAAGLHHAHEQLGMDGQPLGLVHRDVSPSNILIGHDGIVKVVDFGIAKAAHAQVGTGSGMLKGKLGYMSPEQCRAEPIDRRSDVFALGTVLWELTTGQRLFAGESDFKVIQLVADAKVPPPSSIVEDYPPELEAILLKAMRADPNDRFATAREFKVALEKFAADSQLHLSAETVSTRVKSLFDLDPSQIYAIANADTPTGTMTTSRRMKTLFAGELEDMSVADLLQTCNMAGKSGTLRIETQLGRARVWMRKGELVDAELGTTKGLPALHRLLCLHQGTFEMEVGPSDRKQAFDASAPAAIMEGARRLDELNRLGVGLPQVFRRGSFTDQNAGDGIEAKIVEACNGLRSVAGIADLLGLDDLEVAEALAAAHDKGLVVVVPTEAPPPPVASEATRADLIERGDGEEETSDVITAGYAPKKSPVGLLLALLGGAGLVALVGWLALGGPDSPESNGIGDPTPAGTTPTPVPTPVPTPTPKPTSVPAPATTKSSPQPAVDEPPPAKEPASRPSQQKKRPPRGGQTGRRKPSPKPKPVAEKPTPKPTPVEPPPSRPTKDPWDNSKIDEVKDPFDDN